MSGRNYKPVGKQVGALISTLACNTKTRPDDVHVHELVKANYHLHQLVTPLAEFFLLCKNNFLLLNCVLQVSQLHSHLLTSLIYFFCSYIFGCSTT